MQLQLRHPSPRVYWTVLAVATQAGDYQTLKDWTGRFVVSIRRDIYTYSRVNGEKPYPGFQPVIPSLGFVGHMRRAFAGKSRVRVIGLRDNCALVSFVAIRVSSWLW
jgi:hypothetical protein